MPTVDERAAGLLSIDAEVADQRVIMQAIGRARVVRTGHFALERERHSEAVIRLRGLARDPATMRAIADAIVTRGPMPLQRVLVGARLLAPASAGFFLGRALASRQGAELAVARIDLRGRPGKALLAGAIRPNDRVVLVNDVATTGASLELLRQLVTERGGLAVGVVLFGVVGAAGIAAYCARWQLPVHWLATARWAIYPPSSCPSCKIGQRWSSLAQIA